MSCETVSSVCVLSFVSNSFIGIANVALYIVSLLIPHMISSLRIAPLIAFSATPVSVNEITAAVSPATANLIMPLLLLLFISTILSIQLMNSCAFLFTNNSSA